MGAKHTPTPWSVRGSQSIRGPNGEYIAKTNWNSGSQNAEFIVRACNSHAALVEALKALLNHVDRETCRHEVTHRGGAIWTICNDCGRKWADDRGGFVPYTDPAAVAEARAALAFAGETP